MNLPALKRQVAEFSKLIWDKGWVANHDGNITVKLDENRILATPTGISKREIHQEDVLVLDLSTGKLLSGKHRPFSELYMHLEYYHSRGDVGAVIHAHPPVSSSFAVAGVEIEPRILPEAVVSIGARIPMAPVETPGSIQAKNQIRTLSKYFDVLLLENHGPVSAGSDLEQAYLRLELVEHIANIQQRASWLGNCKLVPDRIVEKLLKTRKKAGLGYEARGESVPDDLDVEDSPVEELINMMISQLS